MMLHGAAALRVALRYSARSLATRAPRHGLDTGAPLVATSGSVALYIDLDNVLVSDHTGEVDVAPQDEIIEAVLHEARSHGDGRVSVRRAYGDSVRYSKLRYQLVNSAVEVLDMPNRAVGGASRKNMADIKMAVDCISMALDPRFAHVGTVVIASGDSDFSPVLQRLRELNKHTVVVSRSASTAAMLEAYSDKSVDLDEVITGRAIPPETQDLILKAIYIMTREKPGKFVRSSAVQSFMQKIDPTSAGTLRYLLRRRDMASLCNLKQVGNQRGDQNGGGYMMQLLEEHEDLHERLPLTPLEGVHILRQVMRSASPSIVIGQPRTFHVILAEIHRILQLHHRTQQAKADGDDKDEGMGHALFYNRLKQFALRQGDAANVPTKRVVTLLQHFGLVGIVQPPPPTDEAGQDGGSAGADDAAEPPAATSTSASADVEGGEDAQAAGAEDEVAIADEVANADEEESNEDDEAEGAEGSAEEKSKRRRRRPRPKMVEQRVHLTVPDMDLEQFRRVVDRSILRTALPGHQHGIEPAAWFEFLYGDAPDLPGSTGIKSPKDMGWGEDEAAATDRLALALESLGVDPGLVNVAEGDARIAAASEIQFHELMSPAHRRQGRGRPDSAASSSAYQRQGSVRGDETGPLAQTKSVLSRIWDKVPSIRNHAQK